MVRIKRGTMKRKRHKKILKLAKGHRGVRSRNYRKAIESVMHALMYSYRDRRQRKRDMRRLWITRINAAVRPYGLSYSKFIHGLKLADVEVDRKTLQYIAINDPDTFKALVDRAKEALKAFKELK